MKKMILVILVSYLVQITSAQNATAFDALSYSEPSDWKFTDNGTYRTYLDINHTANTFCILSIYSSDMSSGNSTDDFNKSWKKNVAGHFTTTTNPVPVKQTTTSAIDYVQGEAVISNNQGNLYAELLLFELQDKTQSILFISQNKNMLAHYQADMEKFIASLQSNNSPNINAVTETNNSGNGITSTSTSGQVHFNHFLFTPPAGWTLQQNGAYMNMTAPTQFQDRMLTIILFPPSSDTNFLSAGNASIEELAKTLGGRAYHSAVAGNPSYSMLHDGIYGNSWPYSYGTGEIDITQSTPGNPYASDLVFVVGVYMAKINNRTERMLFLSKDYKCGPTSHSTTYFTQTYQKVIDEFFFDMRWDDAVQPALKQGKILSSGITGIWTGVSYLGTNGVQYDNTFFIFFDNGQVMYDSHFPKRGLLNVNTLSEAARRPDLWGTYSFQNGSGMMKVGSWRNIPFTLKDGKLMAQTGGSTRPFTKLSPVNNVTLNGTWCLNNSCIDFTSGGKFTDHGVIYQLENLPSMCDFTEPNEAQGTYEIKNNSIIFHYPDGVAVQTAITGVTMENGNLSTQKLSLGWYNYILDKR